MKTIVFLLILFSVSVVPVFADELYIWTDENGAIQSSTTRPAWWKDEKGWSRIGSESVSAPERPAAIKTETTAERPADNEEPEGEIKTAGNRPAAFQLPPHVYRMNRLGEAKKRAESTNAAIIFLYTDEYTDCSLATAASLAVLQEFKDSAVIVYASSKDGKNTWRKLPGIVRGAIKSPDAGEYIPIAVVVNSEITGVIAIIPYVGNAEERAERLRKIRAKISRS